MLQKSTTTLTECDPMIELDIFDLLKIGVSIVSIVSIYIFRRQIKKMLTDLVIGGDTSKYVDKSVSEISESIDSRLSEMLK